MASKVREVTSDITSRKQKELLTQIVKHALSLTMNMDEYAKVLEAKNPRDRKELAELLKLKTFKGDLLSHI